MKTQALSSLKSALGPVRREPRRRRLIWLAVAALLVLVPLVFNLTRQSSFETSIPLFPRAVGPYPPVLEPEYYASLLDDAEVRVETRKNTDQGALDWDSVTVRRGRADRLTLTVRADTPRDAQRFANALGPQIVEGTRRRVRAAARAEVTELRARLGTDLSRSTERRVRARVRRLQRLEPLPPPGALHGAPARRPPLERWSDKLVDDLPGDFYARPNPVWAAFAGLLVALTLWAIALVLAPPGARRSAAEPLPGPD